ncbi:MAG: S26 family signal peptidase [Sphingomonadales bacterium]|nr:MAG: S26 family signal peptidase [Sphingomonadales bacterium]
MPLLAWGETLRRARARRRALRRRAAWLAGGIAALGLTIAAPPRPRIIWNASPSAPIGLYRVAAPDDVAPGDMVIARGPERYRGLAAARGYLPATVPLVKRVAGAAGDEVCALDDAIFVNRHMIARRRAVDAKGRTMPWWEGCERLRGRQLFLLMEDSAASFDGRYFGLTSGADVVGKAHLLWAR